MNRAIKHQYDKIADCYAKFEENNPRKHLLIGRQFKRKMRNLWDKSVLDLGCGIGFFATLAKKLKAQYVLGIDISKRMIELAKAEAVKSDLAIDYRVSDIDNLQLHRKFDVVTAGFVFNYAPNRIALRKYIFTASRHLKYGGRLFAILCNPDNPLRDKKVLYRVIPSAMEKLGDGAKLRCEFYDSRGKFLCYDYKFLWSKQTIENILKRFGFHKIEWIDIKNVGKKLKIPALPSTNIILYAIKGEQDRALN